MIFVLFKNLKYQTLTFICLSLAVGLVVAFGPRLLASRLGLLPLFLIDLIVRSFFWRKDSNGRILSILLLCGVTPQNVIMATKCNTNAKCNNNHRKM